MDALTNVVAVLILVLILVQADVTQKVQKFLDDLAPATPEEVAQSKDSNEKLRRDLRLAEARLRETPPGPEAIEEEKRNIALLEKNMNESKVLLADLEKLRKLEEKIRKDRDGENQKTTTIQEEIAMLEAMLDETPVIDPNQPTVVNIPNSRPIPDDAKIYFASAWNDRIHMIDPFTPLAIFNRELERNKKDWILKRIKRKGADAYIYDRAKIEEHFKNFDWGNNRGQKISIVIPPTSTGVRLVISPNLTTGGTPIEELGKPGNAFAQAVAALKRDFDSVLMFRVHPGAFKTYLEARDLIDKINIPAGWDMSWSPEYMVGIPDVIVERTVEPVKPATPSKPPGPQPPPLKPKLD